MASDLFVGTVNHGHLAVHETFKRRVAEPTGKGEDVINTFFFECAGEDFAAAQPSFLCHL